MNKVLESTKFDIVLTEHKDYKSEDVYLLRYGLQVEQFDCVYKAIDGFNSSVQHALECWGY